MKVFYFCTTSEKQAYKMRRKDREVTDANVIREILDKADACRIAFAVDGVPYIVAMNFGYEWTGELPVLYLHCATEGRKLEMLKKNNLVCIQADVDHQLEYHAASGYCTMHYSSIVAMGTAEVVESEEERMKGLCLLMEHHGHEAPFNFPPQSLTRTLVLRVKVSELTAKKKA